MVTKRRTRIDAFPEYANWADTGCILHPSCLTCPLEQCVHETPGGLKAIRDRGRRNRIIQLAREGFSVRDISHNLGIGIRSVYRALQQLTTPP